jgi:hypothetical protein
MFVGSRVDASINFNWGLGAPDIIPDMQVYFLFSIFYFFFFFMSYILSSIHFYAKVLCNPIGGLFYNQMDWMGRSPVHGDLHVLPQFR